MIVVDVQFFLYVNVLLIVWLFVNVLMQSCSQNADEVDDVFVELTTFITRDVFGKQQLSIRFHYVPAESHSRYDL